MTTSPQQSQSAEPKKPPHPFTVVGIGASAGGLKALQSFFSAVQPASGMVYVVILHLDPDRESQMAHLLQNKSSIPVAQVRSPTKVAPDHAYIVPPGKDLAMVDGTIQLSDRADRSHHSPIDHFFRTLGDAYGDSSVCIVLSGTGSDGSVGLRMLREAGGTTFAQEPEDAEYDSMPRSAISTGDVDFVLPASEMPAALRRYTPDHSADAPDSDAATSDSDAAAEDEDEDALLRKIFVRLRSRTGHDFSSYKRSTILRRLDRRIRFTESDTLTDYVKLLAGDADETQALFRDLLITVSGFFRDPDAFGVLEHQVIPKLFQNKGPDDAVRVWVAGCATGEEVYSLAILLSEHSATLPEPPSIQIFASDIDERALQVAREAIYPETISSMLPAKRLERGFERESGGYRVRKAIRKMVLFAAHNLLRDPPFSHVDLITCRNVLIYLDTTAQRSVLESFHYALRPDGYLFLGTSESVGDSALFRAVDAIHRVFTKAPVSHAIVPRLPGIAPPRMANRDGAGRDGADGYGGSGHSSRDRSYGALHLRLLEAWAPPSLVVNEKLDVVHLSEGVGRYLRLAGGEPDANLLTLAPGELGQTLRIALYGALQKQEASKRTVRMNVDGESRLVDVHVRPVDDPGRPGGGEGGGGGGRFALVVFDETTHAEADAAALSEATTGDMSLSEMERDLRRTREQLESTLRAREITIEELQSANEELQSINEEHKATTEEMETSREELQSLNEELTTINQEHRGTIDELQQVNNDLRNLMAASDIGTLFVDRGMRIRRFTPSLTNVFNLVNSDLGRPLTHVTHQLRYDQLIADVEQVVRTLKPVEREVDSRSGGWYDVRIIPYRTLDDRIDGAVLTFYDVSERKRVEEAELLARHSVESEQTRLSAIMDQVPSAVLTVEAPSGRIASFNARAADLWHKAPGVVASVEDYGRYLKGYHADGTRYRAEEWPMARASRTGEIVLDEEIDVEFSDGRRRSLLFSAMPLFAADRSFSECIVSIVDVTERLELERALIVAKEEAESANKVKEQFIATLSHELRTPLNGILGYADLLSVGNELNATQASHVKRIKKAVWHLSSMIDDILSLTRLDGTRDTLARERVDARDLARRAATLAEPTVTSKGLEFVLDLPDEPIAIVTDPVRVVQIIVNLLGNAAKYTDQGHVRLEAHADGGDAVFTVRDSGIGIAPEDKPHVFERFWQASSGLKRTSSGTGLGLSVAREFAALLGGDVTVESERGKGSAFFLRIPLDRG